MNLFKWFGLVWWTLNTIGAAITLVTDELLGRNFTEWMVAALVGWCMWLQATKVSDDQVKAALRKFQ